MDDITFLPFPVAVLHVDIALHHVLLQHHPRAYDHHISMMQITRGNAHDFHLCRALETRDHCVHTARRLQDTWLTRLN